MTPADLDRLVERLEALQQNATQGPWGNHTFLLDEVAKPYRSFGCYVAHTGGGGYSPEKSEANAALIAAAVNAIPALLAAIHDLQARAENAEAIVQHASEEGFRGEATEIPIDTTWLCTNTRDQNRVFVQSHAGASKKGNSPARTADRGTRGFRTAVILIVSARLPRKLAHQGVSTGLLGRQTNGSTTRTAGPISTPLVYSANTVDGSG